MNTIAQIIPTNLRCEYRDNPLGIDDVHPRLSWQLVVDEPQTVRNQSQSAYQVQVASSLTALNQGNADMWDTGRVMSDETTHIRYDGKPLASGQRCLWRVRVWDGDGSPSDYSDAALFEMGLLDESDWSAQWIGADVSYICEPQGLEGCSWIWTSDESAGLSNPAITFEKTFSLPNGHIAAAWFLLTAQERYTLRINGWEVSRGQHWPNAHHVPIHSYLCKGPNTVEVAVMPGQSSSGLIGRLRIHIEGRPLIDMDVDESWHDDARAISAFGEGAWSDNVRITPPARPCPLLRTEFEVDGPVAKATAYATSKGIYELRLNGRKVGEDWFSPGWTDYGKRIQYQTHDITDLLVQGPNALGALLGDGWYAGNLSIYGRHLYGPYPLGLLAQVEIEYGDGRRQCIRTLADGSWRVSPGPIEYSDMHNGERYDAAREYAVCGWDTAGYYDESWSAAVSVERPAGRLVAQYGDPVRHVTTLTPVSVVELCQGVYIYDMGQNMVGNVLVKVTGEAGALVRLRFGEMINDDGSLYTSNLRDAQQTDEYRLAGLGDEECWAPRFTFHGFRYVELTASPIGGISQPSLHTLTGLVLQSAVKTSGAFECSNPMVNKLAKNIEWGQRGNFLSLPTDCPQRDERMGWTGDAQAFAATACYLMDSAAFYTKWMRDVVDAQRDDGAVTDVAPFVPVVGWGTPAWGDACVIVVWTVWQRYGDTGIIEDNYDAMARWVRWMEERTEGCLRPVCGLGDWLSVDAETPRDVLATAFFAYCTELMAQMSAAVGRESDAQGYSDLFGRVKEAFIRAFTDDEGRVKGNTQTAYLLALHMGLLRDTQREAAARHLVADIEERDWHLSTGFVGVGYLNPVLSEMGYDDVAYRLLETESYPSWLYPVVNGATTMWERWNSYTRETGFGDVGMNSFNHYCFGSIGDWLYRYVLGIRTSPDKTGFRQFVVKPHLGGSLRCARGYYESIVGRIEVEWYLSANAIQLDVLVPANATAKVYVPLLSASRRGDGLTTSGNGGRNDCYDDGMRSVTITESGMPADGVAGVCFQGFDGDWAIYSIASGRYCFVSS